MRQLYGENDLVSAEVQSFYADGAVALHTRSLKYGRLSGGESRFQLLHVHAPHTFFLTVHAHFSHPRFTPSNEAVRRQARMQALVRICRRIALCHDRFRKNVKTSRLHDASFVTLP